MAAIAMPPGIPLVPVGELRPDPANPRTHSEAQVAKLAEAIRTVGWTNPIIADDDGTILAGHGRLRAALRLGMTAVPVLTFSDLPAEVRRLILIGDNRLAEDAGWDREALAGLMEELRDGGFSLAATGFDDAEIDAIIAEAQAAADGAAGDTGTDGAGEAEAAPAADAGAPSGAGSLASRFGVPPFSVLNAREGWWQERKRAWLALGIRSELGRGGNLLRLSDTLIEPDPDKRAAMQAARAAE
jgi:hypothetical protein